VITVVQRPRVVIVGAGFAGLSAARALSNSLLEVLLLNRDNYHTFLPLLHQVAAVELEPELVAYPIRRIVRKLPNVQFATAEVKRVDLASQFVETDNCFIPYDFLILATGSTSQFMRVEGAAEYAFPLKKLEQAVSLRNHILNCFEVAAEIADRSLRQQLLTFTIVGGGPTGVEMAGSLAELIDSLVKDYPTLDFRDCRVMLLQAGDSLIPEMPTSLRVYTKSQLQKRGVLVLMRSRVSQVSETAVYLQDSRVIPTKTVIWTAGVCGNYDARAWGLPTANNGKVAVLPTLQVPGHPQVYVVGDLASPKDELPMLAPVAMQQGKVAATNIARIIKGRNPLPMRYQHKGTMVIIGRNAAVANLGKLKLTGFAAWFLWLAVHLFSLAGFRNRLLVLINWLWNYFLGDRIPVILPLQSVAPFQSRKDNHQAKRGNSQ
jgi:NADH:ubiquinone reductase (H+-translocating)